VLGCIWPVSWAAALPTGLYNRVFRPRPQDPPFCLLMFPGRHENTFLMYKYIEAAVFYYTPMCIQIVLYTIVSKHLFTGTDRLYRRVHVRDVHGASFERVSDALSARRGVVKMLILSVFVYFLSYSPHQIFLIYNTVSPNTFENNWTCLVFTMIIAYVNSAANPVLYSIFSQNFRQCFRQLALWLLCKKTPARKWPHYPMSQRTLHGSPRLWRPMSSITASTNI